MIQERIDNSRKPVYYAYYCMKYKFLQSDNHWQNAAAAYLIPFGIAVFLMVAILFLIATGQGGALETGAVPTLLTMFAIALLFYWIHVLLKKEKKLGLVLGYVIAGISCLDMLRSLVTEINLFTAIGMVMWGYIVWMLLQVSRAKKTGKEEVDGEEEEVLEGEVVSGEEVKNS